MPKGSQLSQLKAALSDAGLSRKSQQKDSGKKRKRPAAVAPQQKDKDAVTKKLQDIHQRLNPFDVKVTKLKHDVGGRKLKGVVGKPGQSKQAGIEQRKKTLLVEYEERGHAGGIIDKRFGENNPTLTPEERMLERFTKERQRASKGALFNLEDQHELTHYGQSLSALDDFDSVGLTLGDRDDEDDDRGQIDSKTVAKSHFGGFEEDEEADEEDEEAPPRKKSKAEVMAEVIAKSKEYKYQRQMEKEANENARFQLDQEFDAIRSLVMSETSARPDNAEPLLSLNYPELATKTGSNAIPLGNRAAAAAKDEAVTMRGDDEEYDQYVRELAFDKRAKPKDRTKTEEELALEEKEALEKAERARIRRMMGEEDLSDEEEEGTRKGGRKRKRERGGDDLEDDFVDEEPYGGLGAGLGDQPAEELESESDEEAEEDADAPEESDSEGQSSGPSEAGDTSEMGHDEATDAIPLVPSKAGGKKGQQPETDQELPFTFPCPDSHDEFLSILDGIDDRHLGTVVQRIRALHHPSLSPDNPAKLQVFLGVLIDHVLHVASTSTPNLSSVDSLAPHLFSLTQIYPVASAQAFVAKLNIMHKNLVRGLSLGATSMSSKTWPGLAELCLLRLVGSIWSTSDMNHAVVSPARILMGAYLGLGRVRSVMDISSGLFLCSIFLQFEEFSKRLIPEAINFLVNVILHLAPHPFETPEYVPGWFPVPDFGTDSLIGLKLSSDGEMEHTTVSPPNLLAVLSGPSPGSVQSRLSLLNVALQLLGKFSEMYKGLEGFVELYTPVLEVVQAISLQKFPSDLQDRQTRLKDTLSRLLKFAGQSRRPLLLQAHKPIPIPSYVPKFSSTSSNYLRKQDPDHERVAAAKLRNQLKQERKGAIRELRKDSRFLADVHHKKKMEEADAYSARMKKVFSSIEGERAEQKAQEREKAREKKKSGKK